jgi:hypothetical protein
MVTDRPRSAAGGSLLSAGHKALPRTYRRYIVPLQDTCADADIRPGEAVSLSAHGQTANSSSTVSRNASFVVMRPEGTRDGERREREGVTTGDGSAGTAFDAIWPC